MVTKNRRLEQTTTARTVGGKEEDMLDMKEAMEPVTFDAKAKVAKEISLEAITAVFCVYDDDFRSLHETHGLKSRQDRSASVDLPLYDPLYNVRRPQGLSSSGHDLLNSINMDAFYVFAQMMLKCGGHVYIFCSPLQLASWLRFFCTSKEVVDGLRKEAEAFEV